MSAASPYLTRSVSAPWKGDFSRPGRRAGWACAIASGGTGLATCLAVWLVMGGVAWAHTTGVSQSELRLGAANDVHARLSFALADVDDVIHLDADGDGIVSAEELAVARRGLAAFVDEGVEVTADEGAPCAVPRAMAPALDEADGLTFEGDYACPKAARSITATYFFLDKLARGHRHVATFLAGSATSQRLLTSTSRAITVASTRSTAPGEGPAERAGSSRDDAPWWRGGMLAALVPLAALTVIAALLGRRRVVTHDGVTDSRSASSDAASVAESRRDP